MSMIDNQEKATSRVLEHIGQVREALKVSRDDGFNAEGVFLHPRFQTVTLKVARDELEKAIKIVERMEWR